MRFLALNVPPTPLNLLRFMENLIVAFTDS